MAPLRDHEDSLRGMPEAWRPTVEFYRSQGFEPTEEPNEALFALEPDDIHTSAEL